MARIYTAGKMSGLTFDEQFGWRNYLKLELQARAHKPVDVIIPPLFYNYETQNHKTEHEIKEWELNHLRECDVMVVNLDGVNDTVGTHFELAFADTLNNICDKHIYIIGIGSTDNVHPWILDVLFRIEDNIESAAEYIADYLM